MENHQSCHLAVLKHYFYYHGIRAFQLKESLTEKKKEKKCEGHQKNLPETSKQS